MLQYQIAKYYKEKRTLPAIANCNCLKFTCSILLTLISYSSSAQFINITFEVPTKIQLTEERSLEFEEFFDSETSMQVVGGEGIYCIAGDENFMVQATITHSDVLRNKQGETLPFDVNLAYRNDGSNKPPGIMAGKTASFPLSNSGLIVEYMADKSKSIKAYLFIKAVGNALQNNNSSFTGEINLHVERN